MIRVWLVRLRPWLPLGVVLAFGVLAGLVWARTARPQPPPVHESAEDHFLYGSVGTEGTNGVPYWLWLVLPRVFPDLLPGPEGYPSLGFVGQEGRDMPAGFSRVTIGFPRVGLNCAACHTASYRLRPDDPPTIVPGGPGHTFAIDGYLRFLASAAADPRFRASVLLHEIDRNYRLSTLDRLLYRLLVIPATRRELHRLGTDLDALKGRPAWGRGRADGLAVIKTELLGRPAGDHASQADSPPLWALNVPQARAYHWDGMATSLRDVVRSSALAAGASVDWLDRDTRYWEHDGFTSTSSLQRVQDYLGTLRAPAYPAPVDAALAAAGREVYATTCAVCHDPSGSVVGTVVPAAQVGTDPERAAAWTADDARRVNAFGEGRPWTFSTFRSTGGYVAPPHDGLWLRAPYLHNGSVPTLADLLEPAASRPRRFYRGYDLLDQARVGFVSSGAEAERVGTLVDTSLPGNGNGGHEYGTTLPPERKRALIEYLKTR